MCKDKKIYFLASNNSAYPPPKGGKERKERRGVSTVDPKKLKSGGKERKKEDLAQTSLDFDGNDGKCHDGRKKEMGGGWWNFNLLSLSLNSIFEFQPFLRIIRIRISRSKTFGSCQVF